MTLHILAAVAVALCGWRVAHGGSGSGLAIVGVTLIVTSCCAGRL